MNFVLRAFKQNEFDLTMRIFAAANKTAFVHIGYTLLDGKITAVVDDDVIKTMTKRQLTELRTII